MIKFRAFVTEGTAKQNAHLTHIEDAVLEGGVIGTRNAINYLIALKKMFTGQDTVGFLKEENLIVRWKIDGAPSIFAGINPENGKFFVGSKSIFAQNAKLNYTQSDIMKNHSGGLAEKLSLALRYLPELGIRGIINGDFLFSKSDLQTETIDGKKYITFRPNTITYAVPVDSPLAKEISQSQIGIVWHASYYGNTMDSLRTDYSFNAENLRKSKNVWSKSGKFVDATGKATLTASEEQQLNSLLTSAGSLFRKIPANLLNEIANNATLKTLIMSYTNQKIREGEYIGDKFVNGLVKYVVDRYNLNVTSAKKIETKRNRMVERKMISDWFRKNAHNLKIIFELQKILALAKVIFINKFNQLSELGTFMKTTDGGYRVTQPEGFVVARSADGSVYKLVNRLEFSRENFIQTKGWRKE